MRFSRNHFRRVVKGLLGFEFGGERLTSYGGIELFRQFLSGAGFVRRLGALERKLGIGGDVRAGSMILLFISMLLVGARRLRHVRYLRDDPMIGRFAGLNRLPSERTMSRFLKKFTYRTWPLLDELNFDVTMKSLEYLQVRRLTLDIDGTVVQTGMKAERAKRGFNPHHRKNPSYYPITIQVAQTGQILSHRNRSGNVHDSRGAARFIAETIREVREEIGATPVLEARMDPAFFQQEILDLCDRRSLEYAIKVPMVPWLGMRDRVEAIDTRAWEWVSRSDEVQGAFITVEIPKWNQTLRVAVYRKKVYHPTRKNYQLDLFHPDDGTWEYSAVATNKPLKLKALWEFMNGRGSHEKAYAELRHGYAFGYTPTNRYAANTVWQKLNILTHNLVVAFQLHTCADAKRRSPKRTAVVLIRSIQTLRFTWLNKAARLVNRSGRSVLRFQSNPQTEQLYQRMSRELGFVA